MDEFSPKREIKQGRRAGNLFQVNNQDGSAGKENLQNETSLSPKPTRRHGGWADTNQERRKGQDDDEDVNNNDDEGKYKGKEDEDERIRHDATVLLDNDVDDIPTIPDLDEVQEDDMATQVAAPPSVQVTRVATFKELDHDFEKHSGFLTLDGNIDLKLLGSVLSSESEIVEDDKVWEWDRIFAEVSSDLRTEWEKCKGVVEKD